MEETKQRKDPRINVSSHSMFDLFCISRGLNDENVGNADGMAFISIIGTPECLIHYLDEPDTKHFFKAGPVNVLNLDFDDLSVDEFEWKGHVFKGMTMEQASQVVDFMDNLAKEENKRDFFCHCKAGISRSMGVMAALKDLYPDYFTGDYNIMDTYNRDVYAKICRAYRLKHGMEWLGEREDDE